MRSAKNNDTFPYSSKLICYIEKTKDGEVKQIHNYFEEKSAAYKRAIEENSKIYAVWPGQYNSDLFEIDDLDAFADAHGIPRPDDHKHKISWGYDSHDDGTSRYVRVNIVFECGCKLGDNNVYKIARDLREQLGWDMATSTGWYSDDNGYAVSVRRSSIK